MLSRNRTEDTVDCNVKLHPHMLPVSLQSIHCLMLFYGFYYVAFTGRNDPTLQGQKQEKTRDQVLTYSASSFGLSKQPFFASRVWTLSALYSGRTGCRLWVGYGFWILHLARHYCTNRSPPGHLHCTVFDCCKINHWYPCYCCRSCLLPLGQVLKGETENSDWFKIWTVTTCMLWPCQF